MHLDLITKPIAPTPQMNRVRVGVFGYVERAVGARTRIRGS